MSDKEADQISVIAAMLFIIAVIEFLLVVSVLAS